MAYPAGTDGATLAVTFTPADAGTNCADDVRPGAGLVVTSMIPVTIDHQQTVLFASQSPSGGQFQDVGLVLEGVCYDVTASQSGAGLGSANRATLQAILLSVRGLPAGS